MIIRLIVLMMLYDLIFNGHTMYDQYDEDLLQILMKLLFYLYSTLLFIEMDDLLDIWYILRLYKYIK
jgi:hypothetical protein